MGLPDDGRPCPTHEIFRPATSPGKPNDPLELEIRHSFFWEKQAQGGTVAASGETLRLRAKSGVKSNLS